MSRDHASMRPSPLILLLALMGCMAWVGCVESGGRLLSPGIQDASIRDVEVMDAQSPDARPFDAGEEFECPGALAFEPSCLTLRGSTLFFESPITGDRCRYMDIDSGQWGGSSQVFVMRVDEHSGLLCPDRGPGLHFNRAAGTVRSIGFPCIAATAHQGSLWLVAGERLRDEELLRYDSLDSVGVVAGQAQPDSAVADIWASRFAESWGVIYGAWHSTNELQRVDLRTPTLIETVPLGDHQGWLYGLGIMNPNGVAGVRAVFDDRDGNTLVLDLDSQRWVVRLEGGVRASRAIGRSCLDPTIAE